MNAKVWCFSYGSNQSFAQLEKRLAHAPRGALALLRDHRFAFDKPSRRGGSRANVVPEPGRVVLGTCLELGPAALGALRRYEQGYLEREVEVEWLDRPGERVRAITFVAEERSNDVGPPPSEYVQRIRAGLLERGAPGLWTEFVVRAAAVAPAARRFLPLVRHDGDAAVSTALALESTLVRLSSGWLPAADYDAEVLAGFCASIVSRQRDESSGFAGGSWSILPDARVDGDVRFELGVRPSWVVASTLALVRARLPSVAAKVPELDAALRRGFDFVADAGLAGHGYGRARGMMQAVHDLADGCVPELLAAEPELSPRLAEELRRVRAGLADLAMSAPPRGAWGAPCRFEAEDALARLRGFADA